MLMRVGASLLSSGHDVGDIIVVFQIISPSFRERPGERHRERLDDESQNKIEGLGSKLLFKMHVLPVFLFSTGGNSEKRVDTRNEAA
jgi:hypothetical protein